MRRYRVVLVLTLVLVLSVGSVTCARSTPAPAPAPAPTVAPAPKAAPAPTSAPAPKAAPAPSPAAKPEAKPTGAADFYKNNAVTIITPMAAGGGTDFATRLIAAFWADVFGGDARVKNVTGGGGLVGTNAAWNAKPDGLTIMLTAVNQLVSLALLKEPGVQFDPVKFNYIGMYGDEPHTLAIRKDLPYKSVAELQKAEGLKFGGTSKTGATALSTSIAFQLLGLKNAQVITGFEGTAEIILAMGRGELTGLTMPAGTIKVEADKGAVKPMTIVGFDRSLIFKDIPTVSEATKLSPDDEKLLKLFVGGWKLGRILVAPPGVPQDRV